MIQFINIVKKLMALVFAAGLLFTGGINAAFNGSIYRYEASDGVIGLETLTRAQGVTNDGENWYFSGKNCLEKVNIATGDIIALNTDAIPGELAENFGSKHIGGIGYANGVIYAPVEDSKVWEHPLIVLYNAETLEYTGKYFELDVQKHTRGVPWCFADAQNGVLYAGDSRNDAQAYMYDLSTLAYLGTLDYSEEIKEIQGGEYYNGKLYFGTNDKTRAVYCADASTGEVEKLFDRIMYEYKLIDNFGGEGEDITVLPLENGTYIHTLQIGALFIDATLRHYK